MWTAENTCHGVAILVGSLLRYGALSLARALTRICWTAEHGPDFQLVDVLPATVAARTTLPTYIADQGREAAHGHWTVVTFGDSS